MINVLVVAFALLIWSGCASAPTEAMSAAEKAILDARGVKDCANEKFLAAQRLLEEAEKLVAQERYDEAERKARAAEKLAVEAKKEGELNWEECQRRAAMAEKAANPEADTQDDEQTQPVEENLSLATIYFEYDSAGLSQQARAILAENVRWMRKNEDKRIILEGHTDERGTPEYNLALGESRARRVKEYLAQLGVDVDRLSILSYGEEKPAAFGATPSDFAKNRRVEFVPR
jgi:peptidoglycan-associated lipoprotein